MSIHSEIPPFGLVMTRKVGESLEIDGNITITLVMAKAGYAKLKIRAPRTTRIKRDDAVKGERDDEEREYE